MKLMTTPDDLGPCQVYCEQLKALVREDDERWAALLDWIALKRDAYADSSPVAVALDTILRGIRDLEAGRSSAQKVKI